MELLRLVLMFFIVMHHCLIKCGVMNAGFDNGENLDLLAAFLDPFFFVGVNCFVLISGYFGIEFKFKGLYKLFVQCAFYALLFYLLHLLLNDAKIGKSILDNSLFVFSTPPGWWFVSVYVYLYLLSPVLNKAIDNLSQSQFKLVLLILTILNVYFGFVRQTPFNLDGYSIANFIYLYFIGRYLNLYYVGKKNPIRHFIGYLICASVLGAMVLFKNMVLQHEAVLLNVHVYNNPLLILAAVFLLLTFASIDVSYSKTINWLSFSVFSIYLITENAYVARWYYPYIGNSINGLSPLWSWLCLVAFAIVTMICCILLDKVRLLITIPMDRLSRGIIERLDHRYMNMWGCKNDSAK